MKALLGLTFLVSTAYAAGPHIGYAYPAGGQAGQTVEVVVGGQYIHRTDGVLFSGKGVSAEVERTYRPMNGKERTEITQKLKEARQRISLKGLSASEINQALAKEAGLTEMQIEDLMKQRRDRQNPKRQQNVQIAETATIKVAIDKHADPGWHELRLVMPNGISNPVRFFVGEYREASETISVLDDSVKPVDLGSNLPAVANGQVLPGAVDYVTFSAKKGDSLTLALDARAVTPYMADAVPGWFQAVMQVTDEAGREVAYADHCFYNQDPACHLIVPKDGKYTVRIHDALYRGREDFVYRLTIGNVPYLTGVSSLINGHSQQLVGWNLNSSTLPKFGIPVAPFVPDLPLLKGTRIDRDCLVSGLLSKPKQIDSYQIIAKPGQSLVAEITARRAGSPVDSSLLLLDSKGVVIASNDDSKDPAAGLTVHQADSYLSLKLPQSSVPPYKLMVRDTQGGYGPTYSYVLRVSKPRPDFVLRILPSALTVTPNGAAKVNVQVIPRDGFSGSVKLKLVDAPKWITFTQTGPDSGKITVGQGHRGELLSLRLQGSAMIDGKETVRPGIPAEEMMQAFAWKHLVTVSEWIVKVAGPTKGLNSSSTPFATEIHTNR